MHRIHLELGKDGDLKFRDTVTEMLKRSVVVYSFQGRGF